jgi:hypothetical protein
MTYGELTRSERPWPWREFFKVATFSVQEFAEKGPAVVIEKGEALLEAIREWDGGNVPTAGSGTGPKAPAGSAEKPNVRTILPNLGPGRGTRTPMPVRAAAPKAAASASSATPGRVSLSR